MRSSLLALFMTFLVMGFGDLQGSYSGLARATFGISASKVSLIPVFGALAFGLFALPAGMLATRKGKKWVLQAGLLITAGAHLLPWLLVSRFEQLLGAIFLIGVGMTFLLVAGNPLLRDVTEPLRYSRNLTFAQFFKSLGSIAGPYLLIFLVGLGWSWRSVFPLLAGAALVTWAALTLVTVPEVPPERPAKLKAMLRLLLDPSLGWKILGIFLYSGSEMGLNTFLASHLNLTYGMDLQGAAITCGQGLFWLSQGAGRLLGTLALTWMGTARFFLLCALAGLVGLAGLLWGSREVAVASVVLCGLAFSNIWPSLFVLTVEVRPRQASELGGLVIMGNAGGMLLPFLMGKVTDLTAVRWGFLVPGAAFLYLLVLAVGLRAKSGPPSP